MRNLSYNQFPGKQISTTAREEKVWVGEENEKRDKR